jgi:signal transduction histidine kinase
MNLRTRFLVSQLIVAGGVLLLVGGVVYLEWRGQLTRRFDEDLIDRVRRAVPVGVRPGALPAGLCSASRLLELVDVEGRVVSSCPGFRMPKAGSVAIQEALVQGFALRTKELPGGPVRVALVPYTGEETEPAHLLQAGEPLHSLLDARSELARSFFVTFGGALLLVAIASYVAMRRSLVRLTRTADQARSILRGDLAGRLVEEGATDEFGELVDVVNELLDRLERATGAQRRFVADAARELATPLAELRAELDRLASECAAAQERVELTRIREEVQRIGGLVDSLLLFARIDAGLERVPPDEQADLSELTPRVLEREGKSFAEKGIQIEPQLAAGAVVHGSAALLESMVGSLVHNAAGHARAGGKVRVAVSADSSAVTVIVEDDGPGIPPEHRERIFDRFVRGAGAGFFGSGLALARDIVTLHGGTITVHDSPLGGAKLEVRLPRVAGQGNDSLAPVSASA